MEGKFCYGPTNALRDSTQGWGEHGLAVPRFGISRKTGYKILERYEQCGLDGLSDRASRPFRYANQLPKPVEAAIVAAKREKPHWGARKICERLLRRLPHAVKVPAASTVHVVLDRHGLGTRMRRSRTRAEPRFRSKPKSCPVRTRSLAQSPKLRHIDSLRDWPKIPPRSMRTTHADRMPSFSGKKGLT